MSNATTTNCSADDVIGESSDDILAKYAAKKPTTSENQLSTSDQVILHHQCSSSTSGGGGNDVPETEEDMANDSSDGGAIAAGGERLHLAGNIEDTDAFRDAKRKLRLMLPEADLSLLASLPSFSTNCQHRSADNTTNNNLLVCVIRVQLAEALNLQDRDLVAKLHETLRCLELFDAQGCRKLVRALREDYKNRSPYLSYLIRCRQGLLATLAHQERLLKRLQADKSVCTTYLVTVVIRAFLQKQEMQLQRFKAQFKATPAPDEKAEQLTLFLAQLMSQLESDSSKICTLLEPHRDLCETTVERSVFSLIYQHAMYPNGNADQERDAIFAENIRKLASQISPDHPDLRIPERYRYEQPWPSAQAEIRRLAAFKTPRDKVACVQRCVKTIINLLSLASGKSSAADDLVPVMVFVVIKANPAALFSTVQYVNSFIREMGGGEEEYAWRTFEAAINFINTMIQ